MNNLHDRPLIEQMAVAYATEIERLRTALESVRHLLHGDRYSKKIRTALQIISDALANEEGK